MNFFSNLADTIPVVGHVKGVFHHVAGDTEGGNKAMYQATRTTAVLGAGAAGSLAGPGGAAVAAMYAGALTDSVVSVAMNKPQGLVKGCTNIAKDINEGKSPMRSIASTGLQVGIDAIGGLGMGGVSSAASQVTGKTVAKKAIQTAVVKADTALVSAYVCMRADESRQVEEEREWRDSEERQRRDREQREREERERRDREERQRRDREQREREERERRDREERQRRDREQREREERERRDREERQRRDREQREREERERRDREQQEQRAREQLQQGVREQVEQCSTPESNSGSSQPPQGNRNNNDQPRKNKPNYFAIFKNLLEEILDVIFGVERPYTRVSISRIFQRLSKAQKGYLGKIIERLYKGGILIEVLILVIRIFSEHFPGDISFTNFLSLTEFVAVYIEEEIDYRTEVFRMAEQISRENNSSIPEEQFENLRARIISSIMNLPDIVSIIVDIFVRLRFDIESELLPFEISDTLLVSRELSSNFRDVFSAIYHYFKHRCVPGDGVLSVREYYDWIRRVLEELGRHQDYRNLLQVRNTKDVRANVKFEMFIVIFGRRIRIVVRLQGDSIGLSTCFVIDDTTDGDEEGTVSIDIHHK